MCFFAFSLCCDVNRTSLGRSENSCFVWLKFARVVQMLNVLSSSKELHMGKCGTKTALALVSNILFQLSTVKLLT